MCGKRNGVLAQVGYWSDVDSYRQGQNECTIMADQSGVPCACLLRHIDRVWCGKRPFNGIVSVVSFSLKHNINQHEASCVLTYLQPKYVSTKKKQLNNQQVSVDKKIAKLLLKSPNNELL